MDKPLHPVMRGQPSAWIDGELKPCSLDDFVRSLRRYAGWARYEFGTRSDPAAHLSERLDAAADLIEAMADHPGPVQPAAQADLVEELARIIDPEGFGLPDNTEPGTLVDRDEARDRARLILRHLGHVQQRRDDK